MQEVYVNGSDFDSVEEIFDYLGEELELHVTGLNALYEELTELGDDTKITMDMSQVTDDTRLDAMEKMAEVMEDAAGENDYLEISCIE